MKKTIKGFLLGVIITTMLMSTVFGAQVKKTIDVIYNSVNVTLNGAKVDTDNFLYEGTTYLPLRVISEMLGKEVGWDGDTYTASIYDKGNEKGKEVFYDESKKILWDENNMHFDRIRFGDNLEKIVYRMGEDPDEIIKNDDGSIIYKCIISPVKEYSTDKNGNRIFIRDVTPEETVYFYTNGPEQIKRENLKGVYKIVTDSKWSAMMGTSNVANGTYEGLLKTYGSPDSREIIDSNGTEKIWYQLQSNKTRYLFFDIKDENIINHGMEIKY